MILIPLIAGVFLFVVLILASEASWFSAHRIIHAVLIALCLLMFIGSGTLIVLNDHDHLGMKEVVKSHKLQIYSIAGSQTSGASSQIASRANVPSFPFIVLSKDIGKDRLYIFNVQKNGKPKMKHTAITDRNSFKNTKENTAYLMINKKMRVFKNKFYSQLFAYIGSNNIHISTENIFYLPKAHKVMTASQLKKMQKVIQAKLEALKKDKQGMLQAPKKELKSHQGTQQ